MTIVHADSLGKLLRYLDKQQTSTRAKVDELSTKLVCSEIIRIATLKFIF
jgi:hypothetical protein